MVEKIILAGLYLEAMKRIIEPIESIRSQILALPRDKQEEQIIAANCYISNILNNSFANDFYKIFHNQRDIPSNLIEPIFENYLLNKKCLPLSMSPVVAFLKDNLHLDELDFRHFAGEIKDITRATTPFDFEGKLFRYCFKVRK